MWLTKSNEKIIIDCIKSAEQQTSGEIKVHVEKVCKIDPYIRAAKVFKQLGLTKTKQKNASLIYLAYESKTFAVIGDSGINTLVPKDFWDSIRDGMLEHFRKEQFTEGICLAINRIGEKLKAYFPYHRDDVNEISDNISTMENLDKTENSK